jgi:transcriptional regulator with XRE-family HTH domain
VKGLFTDIGQKIRTLRTQRGLSIQDLAKKLDVSVGYLSNLETGKRENIQFTLLQKLQEEFSLFSPELGDTLEKNDDFELRLLHINQLLRKLNEVDQEQSDYLISLVEKGTELFTKEK